jgi:hypothetical protein
MMSSAPALSHRRATTMTGPAATPLPSPRTARARLRGLAPPRNADFVDLLETVLISGVTTILVIRTQLWLTNYPQLGGRGLHIAHLLWGGLFMLVTIGLLLSFLGRRLRRPAAVLGGVGFGFFIDELGKFITADNDYFFRPAAGLIYLIFVLFFLLIVHLRRGRDLSTHERTANAIFLTVDAADGRLHERDRERAVALLDRADQDDPLVPPLRRLLTELRGLPSPPARFYERWADAIRTAYLEATERPWFRPLVTAVFVVWALNGVFVVIGTVLSFGLDLGGVARQFADDRLLSVSFLNVATVGTQAVSIALIVLGLARLRRDRLAAYRCFERALLVSILLTKVFIFVRSQFGAVFGVGLDIVLLISVRSMMGAEEGRAETTPPAGDPAAAAEPVLPPLAAPGAPPP